MIISKYAKRQLDCRSLIIPGKIEIDKLLAILPVHTYVHTPNQTVFLFFIHDLTITFIFDTPICWLLSITPENEFCVVDIFLN